MERLQINFQDDASIKSDDISHAKSSDKHHSFLFGKCVELKHFVEDDVTKAKGESMLQISDAESYLVEAVWLDDISRIKLFLNQNNDSLDLTIAFRLLNLACRLDSVACAHVLLEHVPGVNEFDESGLTPLHNAASMHSKKCIDLLLKLNAQTDLKSKDADSLLALEISLSCRRMQVDWSPIEPIQELIALLRKRIGDEYVSKLLLEAGTDTSQTDAFGNSALHMCLGTASAMQKLRLIWLLLKHGASVSQQNLLGLTPVHVAAEMGDYQALQILLLQAPECVDIASKRKETPLFFAARNGFLDCTVLLMQYGANSQAINLRGQRAVDVANSQEIRRLILNPINQDFLNCAITSQKDNHGVLATLEIDSNVQQSVVSNSQNTELCRYYMSSSGCARGLKLIFSQDIAKPDVVDRKIFVGGLPFSVDSGWSNINKDLLDLIMKRLGLIEFVRAGAVCQSWRSTMKSCGRPKSQPPWLILSSPHQPDFRYVSNLEADQKFLCQFNLPNLKHHHIVGCSHGFIISVDEICQIHATNPITGSHRLLPAITTLPCCEGVVRDPITNQISHYWIQGYPPPTSPIECHVHYVQKFLCNKVALFPTSSAAGLVSVLVHNVMQELAFARQSDESWTYIQSPIENFDDVLFYKGLLYAVTYEGELFAFDILNYSASSQPVIDQGGWAGKSAYHSGRKYLVQSPCGSDLFLIGRLIDLRPVDRNGGGVETVAKTERFTIHKLNQDCCQWIEVSSFGTEPVVVFLGFSPSVMRLAKDIPGIAMNMGDSIYFTDDDNWNSSHHRVQNTSDMGIFYLEDYRIVPLDISNDHRQQFNYPPPFWFTAVNK